MRPLLRLLPLAALLATATVRAQAPADSKIAVRVVGGLNTLSLGEAAAFHQSVADAYVAAGVPVPTQRSFPAGPLVGAEALWSTGSGARFGVGARHTSSSAYSLYGDYAGTLDVVSHVSALFVETVSLVEFKEGRAVRPFLGSRGGTVFASSSTREALVLESVSPIRSEVGGRGTGFSIEGFGGASVAAGPVDVFVQGGYRYARVARLSGDVQVGGQVVQEGDLPYRLGLSGWTGVVGLTLRR